jgi:hypothetical protein
VCTSRHRAGHAYHYPQVYNGTQFDAANFVSTPNPIAARLDPSLQPIFSPLALLFDVPLSMLAALYHQNFSCCIMHAFPLTICPMFASLYVNKTQQKKKKKKKS